MLAQWKEIVIHVDNKIINIYKLNDKERLESPLKQKRRRLKDRMKNDQKIKSNENTSKKTLKESRKNDFQICSQDIFSYKGIIDLQNYLQKNDNSDQKKVEIKKHNQNANKNSDLSLEYILNSTGYAQHECEFDDDDFQI